MQSNKLSTIDIDVSCLPLDIQKLAIRDLLLYMPFSIRKTFVEEDGSCHHETSYVCLVHDNDINVRQLY